MPKQILVAEDSATIQKAIEICFAREDVVLTQVRTGDEAIAKAHLLKPDIVLADAGLVGGKSGYDICAALRADTMLAMTPFLLLTGNFSPFDEAKGQKSGADGYIVKPFETQALIDKVNETIAKRGKTTQTTSATLMGVSAPSLIPPVAAAAPAPTPAPVAPPAPAPAPPKPTPFVAAPPASTPAPPPPVVAAPKPVEPQATPTAKTVIGASLSDLLGKGGPARITSGSMAAINPADYADPPAPSKPEPVKIEQMVVKPEPPKPAPPVAAPVAPPVAPPKPVVAENKATPAAATMMMEAPVIPKPEPPKPAPPPVIAKPVEVKRASLPKDVPQMPRAPLIPNTAVPTAAVLAAAAHVASSPPPRHAPAPKATLMGIPTIGMPGLGLAASSAASAPGPVPVPAPIPTPAPAPKPEPAPAPAATAKLTAQSIPDAPTPKPAALEQAAVIASAASSAVDRVEARLAEKGPEYAVLAKLTREAIEGIIWEIVPELAEVIIKENIDKLAKSK